MFSPYIRPRRASVRWGLHDFLTAQQASELAQTGMISFTGSGGGLYRIVTAQHKTHNVQVRSPNGVIFEVTGKPRHQCSCGDCLRPPCRIPFNVVMCAVPYGAARMDAQDVWLQQMLLLQVDEQEFLRIANFGSVYDFEAGTGGRSWTWTEISAEF